MAALLESRTGIKPDVVEGGRGEFTVWVGNTKVAQKDANGFPEDDQVLAAVQTSLTSGSKNP